MCRNSIEIRPPQAARLGQASNPAKRSRASVPTVLAILLISTTTALASSASDPSRGKVLKIVAQIQRADYEGDRAALKRLHGELTPFVKNEDLAAHVRYWRGFALWRRAINGFNDSVETNEQEADLKQAVDEFDEAARAEPSFVDAKIGAASCLNMIIYGLGKDPVQQHDLIARSRKLTADAEAAAPENPRLLWVLGPNRWYASPEHGGSQAKAMEMYQRGLDVIRKHKTTTNDPLEPSWGEAELLMSLAWSNLNRTTPDLDAAEHDAHSALELVPYWHYVRDILEPQIRAAQRKQK
jgi:hypothetical protein